VTDGIYDTFAGDGVEALAAVGGVGLPVRSPRPTDEKLRDTS